MHYAQWVSLTIVCLLELEICSIMLIPKKSSRKGIFNVSPFLILFHSRLSTVAFSRESLDSFSAPWNSPQSPFPQADSLPYPQGLSSHQVPRNNDNTVDQSLNSELTVPRQQEGLREPEESAIPTHDPRLRTSSEITVNNNIVKQSNQQVISPTDRERDSNMFEISEEEMNGGYLARSVIAPGISIFPSFDIQLRCLLYWNN